MSDQRRTVPSETPSSRAAWDVESPNGREFIPCICKGMSAIWQRLTSSVKQWGAFAQPLRQNVTGEAVPERMRGVGRSGVACRSRCSRSAPAASGRRCRGRASRPSRRTCCKRSSAPGPRRAGGWHAALSLRRARRSTTGSCRRSARRSPPPPISWRSGCERSEEAALQLGFLIGATTRGAAQHRRLPGRPVEPHRGRRRARRRPTPRGAAARARAARAGRATAQRR